MNFIVKWVQFFNVNGIFNGRVWRYSSFDFGLGTSPEDQNYTFVTWIRYKKGIKRRFSFFFFFGGGGYSMCFSTEKKIAWPQTLNSEHTFLDTSSFCTNFYQINFVLTWNQIVWFIITICLFQIAKTFNVKSTILTSTILLVYLWIDRGDCTAIFGISMVHGDGWIKEF